MSIISKIFSGGAEKLVGTIGGIVDDLTLSKEEKEKLKIDTLNAVNAHEEKMASLAQSELESQLKDIQSARDSNVKIQESEKASFWAKNTAYFLDVFIGAIWGFITVFLVAKALHLADNLNADMTAVLSIYSTVTAIFMICINFHRGTSIGSQNKQKTIDKLMK